MYQKNRTVFYISWHIAWGLLIAYGVAFVVLHGSSLYYTGLDYWHQDAVWRTISYVIPKWHLVIIPAGCMVMVLSFVAHGLLHGMARDEENLTMGCAVLLALLAAAFFLLVFQFASLFIFIPLIAECMLLAGIDIAWDRRLEEKPKRKTHNEA